MSPPPAMDDKIAEHGAECRPGPEFRSWLSKYLPPGHSISYAQLVIDAHAEFDYVDKPAIRNWLTALAASGDGSYSFMNPSPESDSDIVYRAAPLPGVGKGGRD